MEPGKTGSALSGMTAIRDFNRSINLASSEASVIQMIRDEEFPAKKLGGIWESDKDMIIAWRKSRLVSKKESLLPTTTKTVADKAKSKGNRKNKK